MSRDLRAPACPSRALDLGEFAGAGVSLVIPAYEDSAHLRRALWSIEHSTDLPFQLVISCARQCVARNRNAGLDRATQDLVVFMDDDVLLPAGWLSPLVALLASRADIGAVAPVLRFPDGSPQLKRSELAPGECWDIALPGTLFLYSRRRVEDQRFDEDFLGSQWEDTDWMWRVRRRGLATLVTGSVAILHEHRAVENAYFDENAAHFHSKWGRFPDPEELASIEPEAHAAWTPPSIEELDGGA